MLTIGPFISEHPAGTTNMSDIDNKRAGGVTISGQVGTIHGDIVGRDKVAFLTTADFESALSPIANYIDSVPAPQRLEAEARLSALKLEVAKGERADDTIVAKIIESLVKGVPAAATAVVSSFANPLLGAVAGPVTAYVIEKLHGE